ncbi:MAG: hypothetical protein IIY21_22670 [Clostridiales bacterium]|nr:hypothetical protein [Clostridiales bacterium]MBQ1572229.1 hypothetical protein [Clostridiales bacterium]
MNCFMGYNPLVTKQVKVTVWVCEQDGATPVAPSNPSEGDCFIVYATDEAVLSNSPTSAKTYTNGDWADAEGGGGGAVIPEVTLTGTKEGTYTSTVSYQEMMNLILNSPWEDQEGKVYPFLEKRDLGIGVASNFRTTICYENKIYMEDVVLNEDGTYTSD